MRPFFLGLLGALVALVLAGGAFVAWAHARPDPRRAALERQIDEYETWAQGPHFPATAFYYCCPATYNIDINTENSDFALFLAQRPELRAYFAWLYEARLAATGRGLMGEFQARHPTGDDIAAPKYLDRYLAETRR